MTVKEMAEGIRELLGPGGEHWGRGWAVTVDDHGQAHYCLVGAARMVATGHPNLTLPGPGLILAMAAAVESEPSEFPYGSVASFNDGATWPDIVAFLNRLERS